MYCITRIFPRAISKTIRLTPSIPVRTMATDTASNGPVPTESGYKPRYIDIGINLADPVFRGKYYGVQRHPDDLDAVVKRAVDTGCQKFIVTGSDFKSIQGGLRLAAEYPGTVFGTAGIHPCSSSMFSIKPPKGPDDGSSTPCEVDHNAPISEDIHPDPQKSAEVMGKLKAVVDEAISSGNGHLVALGEFGLDYDRLNCCNRRVQLHSFAEQLKLAASLEPQLPLFLHSRAAHSDFVRVMKEAFGDKLENLQKGGVVHSFTGTADEMQELMDLGLYIGINGCSFKTEENCETVKAVSLDRIMIETDGPWCEVRPSHTGYKYLIEKKPSANGDLVDDQPLSGTSTPASVSSEPQKKKNQKKEPDVPEKYRSVKKEKWVEGVMIKGRNEPCSIDRIAKIVAGIKGIAVEEVCEAAWRNTVRVFDIEGQK